MRLLFLALAACSIAAFEYVSSPNEPAGARAPATLAARNYLSSAQCADPSVTATFAIPGADALAPQFGGAVPSQIWIDLSLYGDTFPPGWFVGSGPHAPGPTTRLFAWQGLLPGLTHWYRLNGWFADGWRTIGAGAFESPNCQSIAGIRCNNDGETTSVVTFRLPPAPNVGGAEPVQQWIDVSMLDFNFGRAPFENAGPFSPAGAVVDFHTVGFGRQHNYRFNALYANGTWRVHVGGTFRPLDCHNLPAGGYA
jgi:hypothetical protein